MERNKCVNVVYILSRIVDNIINLRPNSTKKHSHLRSALKMLILTKYKVKLVAIVSLTTL